MSEPNVPPPPPYYTPPPPPAGPGPGSVSQNRNIMIVLAYLGPLFLVPLLAEKEDREVQWHAKNGMCLFLAWVAVWIVVVVLGMVLAAVFAPLACLWTILHLLLFLGYIVLTILCIVKGINGQRMVIPVVSQFAEKF
jgi:uncharacterized membrane protein